MPATMPEDDDMVTSVSLTNPGSAYPSTIGTGGTTSSVHYNTTHGYIYLASGNGSNTWYSGATSTAGSNGGHSINSSVTIATTKFTDNDITISRPGGKQLKIANTLERIMEQMMLIVPDDDELDNNPALKAAYNNYLEVLHASRDPAAKEAYDSYHTIRKLVNDD